MPVVFFEGFNSSNTDTIKLDPNYWAVTGGNSNLNFANMRTGNGVQLRNRPIASGLELNTVLTLSNFTDPIISHSGFGLGFYIPQYGLRSRPIGYEPSGTENLVSFYDNTGEVLRLDIVHTLYGGSASIGLAVYEGATLVDIYDIESVLGNSWSVVNLGVGHSGIDYPSYLEMFIDPTNGNMAVRLSANNTSEAHLLNSSNAIYTNITGFSELSGVKFYGNNDYISGPFGNTGLDDLYLTAGNGVGECLLGNSTKIYRHFPDNNVAPTPTGWFGTGGGSPEYYYINSNNGDTDYIYSSTPGESGVFEMSNISEPAPSGVGGVKVINVVKKSSLETDMSFTNIMSSGVGEPMVDIGSPHLVDNPGYQYRNEFFFENPLTSSPWTKDDVNNMQLGVKIV